MATKKTATKTTTSKKAVSERPAAEASPARSAPAKKASTPAKKAAGGKSGTADLQAGSGGGAKAAPTHGEIATLAHRYWEERGGHHGSHVGDWLRAERELKGE